MKCRRRCLIHLLGTRCVVVMRWLTLVFCVIAFQVTQAQENQEATEALAMFEQYVPTIEKSQHLTVQFRRAVVGDLNGDDVNDVIVEFGLGKRHANTLLSKQAAIYISENGGPRVAGGFEPSWCMHIEGIAQGHIKIAELKTCAGAWPETVALHYFKWQDNRLQEVQETPVK